MAGFGVLGVGRGGVCRGCTGCGVCEGERKGSVVMEVGRRYLSVVVLAGLSQGPGLGVQAGAGGGGGWGVWGGGGGLWGVCPAGGVGGGGRRGGVGCVRERGRGVW